jgi:hypothetical protein
VTGGTRARAGLAAFGAIAAAALSGAGCDWRQFDALENRAPVVSVSAPTGFPASQDFGQVLRAVAPPSDGSVAARALVSSEGQTGVAAISFDAHGSAVAQSLGGAAFDDLQGVAVWAIAEVKGSRQALLGAPSAARGSALLLDLDPPYASALLLAASEPQFGAGVAAGALGGGPADDLVVMSASTLHVFVDGGTAATNAYYSDTGGAATCPIFLSDALPVRFRVDRPVLIANVLGGAANQLIVGTPSPSGAGAVAIFNVDTTGGAASCALTLAAPSGEKQFGQSIAVGDFDGDGIPDLLVGAPPTHAYLFRGPITGLPTMPPVFNPAGIGFGGAVAAIHVEGAKGDQAYIADPDATVGGLTAAGNVSIYTFSAAGTPTMVKPTPALTVLSDRSPSASGAFGSAIVSLPFCTSKTLAPDGGVDAGHPDGGTDAGAPADAGAADAGAHAPACTTVAVPLVGAATKVLGYFTLGGFDPRNN